MFLSSCLLILALQATTVLGNTEKVIFLGPASFQVPTEHPTIEDLHLEVLTPQRLSLRTHIKAQFPTDSEKYGLATWLVLDQLQEGQRYEVRVCWAATVCSSDHYWTMKEQSTLLRVSNNALLATHILPSRCL